MAWIVEQTGGGCTADVARITDDRTGQDVAVVVTDGNHCAFTTSDLERDKALSVGVYLAESWWGDAEDRDPVAEEWVEDIDPRDTFAICATAILDALGEAGVTLGDEDPHGHSATVWSLAAALVGAQ